MVGTLIISLDFELFWGMHDRCTLEQYKDNILGGRAGIPQLLSLFQAFDIHATWATVGMLMGKGPEELAPYLPADVPSYTCKELSPYPFLNTLYEKDPIYFAPELPILISKTPGQEIGSHTFCHYYCREDGQTTEQFRRDMEASKSISASKGFAVESVVLPRNQSEPAYTEILRNLGFTSYRDEENDWIHEKVKFRPLMRALRLADVYLPLTGHGCFTPKNENGIVNIVGSRMYKPRFIGFLEPLKMRRIKKQMLHAAKHDLCFHLWWHPHNIGVDTEYHLSQLEEIFRYYKKLQEAYGMRSLNMGELAHEVLGT
ncbi:MAG: polysaccharide deacetylase family protein [Oscillospiraceae bacterium]|nr:polysaccharide deacetylase family protein [Oscillospiraceae bacterium]